MPFLVFPKGRFQDPAVLPGAQLQLMRQWALRNPVGFLTQGQHCDFSVYLHPREENLELKKLLMSNGNKEGASGQPGSPKMEGAGKKAVAGQQQVCGQKFLL